MLTAEQEAAAALVLKTIQARGECSLLGPAGAGKTFTLRAVLQRLPEGEVPLVACISHRARRVVEAGLEGLPELRTSTIASLLRLQPAVDQTTGEVVFRRSSADPLLASALRTGPPVTALLIDEASMVAADQADALAAIAQQLGAALVWCGDPAQLPPIAGGEGGDGGVAAQSPRFTSNPNEARLRAVLRTASGPVLALSVAIRESAHPAMVWPAASQHGADSRVVLHPHRGAWRAAAYRAISDPRWAEDPDRARLLFWTHNSANSAAAAIRAQLYGATAGQQWNEGEWLCAVRGLAAEGSALGNPVASSCSELLVTAVGPAEVLAHNLGSFVWRTPAKGLERLVEVAAETTASRCTVLDRATGLEHRIWLEPPSATGSWSAQVRAVRSLVRTHIHERNERKRLLELAADLESYVPWCRPAMTSTTHAVQGGSYDEIWVGACVGWCPDLEVQRRLCYVAVSRARTAAHLLPWAGGGAAAAVAPAPGLEVA